MKRNIITKVCSTCEQEKCIDEFTKRKSAVDGHNASCRTCTRPRTRTHYENNKAYYAAKNRRRKEETRRRIAEVPSKNATKQRLISDYTSLESALSLVGKATGS